MGRATAIRASDRVSARPTSSSWPESLREPERHSRVAALLPSERHSRVAALLPSNDIPGTLRSCPPNDIPGRCAPALRTALGLVSNLDACSTKDRPPDCGRHSRHLTGCANTDAWVDAHPAAGWPAQYGDAANSSYADVAGADALNLEWTRSVKGDLARRGGAGVGSLSGRRMARPRPAAR